MPSRKTPQDKAPVSEAPKPASETKNESSSSTFAKSVLDQVGSVFGTVIGYFIIFFLIVLIVLIVPQVRSLILPLIPAPLQTTVSELIPSTVVPLSQPTALLTTSVILVSPSHSAQIALSPTETATPTPDIAQVVATIDALATFDRATDIVRLTAAARATDMSVGTRSAVDASLTATYWTATLTPDITASIQAFRTEQARTAAAQFQNDLTATARIWTPTSTLTATTAPLGFSGYPVANNAQWQPFIDQYIQTFDGVEMVLVPVGCFMMGSNGEAGRQCFDAPFFIDRYEVTNEQFARLGGSELTERSSNWTNEQHPREMIAWREALDFCTRREGYLPTEAEWEYAARGPDSWVYPWGNAFNADKLVYLSNAQGTTAAVGSRPEGASWVGAFDMSGNVWEWVSTLSTAFPVVYATDDGRENLSYITRARGVRGGSWLNNNEFLRTDYHGGSHPMVVNSGIGFRCARPIG